MRGTSLENITWLKAERLLTRDTIVVLPLGAGAKEHGPHLPLNNDSLLARYLADRVVARTEVALLPVINYSYYPAFVEYPGSTTLRLETARDVIIDIVRSVARHGPRRFYVLNTGVSTLQALKPAAEILRVDGVLLHYTDLHRCTAEVCNRICEQPAGTHADEIETSMMLYIAPHVVDMSKAVRDIHDGPGPLTRDPARKGAYSPSGVYGDPTLATRDKGMQIVEALVEAILLEIEALRIAELPLHER